MAFIIHPRGAIIFLSLFLLTHQSVVVNHDLSPALSELFLDYDSNVRPPSLVPVFKGETAFSDVISGPTIVETCLHVQKIWRQKDQIVLVVILTQKWLDDRLEFKSPEHLKAKYAVLSDKIWTPDTFPMDAVEYSTLHDGYFQITGNGTVRLSKIVKLSLMDSDRRGIEIPKMEFHFESKAENFSQYANFTPKFSDTNSSIEISTEEKFGHVINFVSFVYDSAEVKFSCRETDECFTVNPDIRDKFRFFECSTFPEYGIGDRIHSSLRCNFDIV